MTRRRVLIVGGTGVLSRAIAEVLLERGDGVTLLTDGKGALQAPTGARHLVADRNDPRRLHAALASEGPWDLVVDAVCYTPTQARYLLRLIRGRSRHVIVVSTTIIYDAQASFPIDESTQLAHPRHLQEYGRGKAGMERVWRYGALADGPPVTILRLPHILGEGCDLGVVPLHNRDITLVPRLWHHEPLFLADGGQQLLQFVFARDVGAVVDSVALNGRAFGQVLNCANPAPATARRYYQHIAELLSVPLSIRPVPANLIRRSGWGWLPTCVSRIVDLTRLHSVGALIPRTSLRHALEVSLSSVLQRGRLSAIYDSYLDLDAALLDPGGDAIPVLARLARRRQRTPVDIRMNGSVERKGLDTNRRAPTPATRFRGSSHAPAPTRRAAP